MKKVRATTGILAIAMITFTATSCKDNKKEHDNTDGHHSQQMEESGHMEGENEGHSGMDHGDMDSMDKEKAMVSSPIIGHYIKLKNALVADSKEGAAEEGENLLSALNDFDQGKFTGEQQKELRDIIEDASEHAEHIAKSPLGHQREHFDVLSKDVIDLIAITGTDKTLYQDFCPMYNNNKGAQWLSENKEIKNPYYGSKMLSCGSLEKQIN
ncbi:DUF3347 domain-containing protein [Flagellimonas pacifica]|uniref:DUF3347 domain-containing protein n=1 Tax=Flagellimonas pacifica TaxID=1247520 RepID=A0A285MZW9_9FLAO|nr:DUF3347 domain-containing protein [Allomuricauda parva]SNZ01326.1 Protein of unknown function [Allomuricauda parva]